MTEMIAKHYITRLQNMGTKRNSVNQVQCRPPLIYFSLEQSHYSCGSTFLQPQLTDTTCHTWSALLVRRNVLLTVTKETNPTDLYSSNRKLKKKKNWDWEQRAKDYTSPREMWRRVASLSSLISSSNSSFLAQVPILFYLLSISIQIKKNLNFYLSYLLCLFIHDFWQSFFIAVL